MEQGHSNKKTPALTKALTYLRANLNSKKWTDGMRLPTCHQLAVQAQVGPVVMLKAIDVLKKEKLITSQRKIGIYAGSQIPISQSTKVEHDSRGLFDADALTAKLRADILEGAFHDMEHLPSIKELMTFYTIGYASLKKVVGRLVTEELLIPVKRKFRIRSFTNTAPFHKLYFIMCDRIFSSLIRSFEQTWIEQFSRTLEKECYRRNILLVKCPYSRFSKRPSDFDDALGYIIWHTRDLRKDILDCLHTLLQYKKTVASMNIFSIDLNERSILTNIAQLSTKYPLLLTSGFEHDTLAGYKMGRFLYEKGHRRIYYFAYDFKSRTVWQEDRYKGLCKAFESLGVHNAVVPVFVSSYADQKGAAGPEKAEHIRLFKSLEREKSVLDKGIDTLTRTKLSSNYFENRLVNQIREYKGWIDLRKMFTPYFQNAVKDKDVTAWVCANDYIAIYAALEFLKSEKIEVPGRIAVTGFDDQLESSFRNMSSYHFDFSGAALRILNFISFPKSNSVRHAGQPNVFTVDGMVIDRGSA